jgi:hypothetical protein
MSPKSSPSQYVVAVIVALLSIAAYLVTSSFPLAVTSVELVVLFYSFCFLQLPFARALHAYLSVPCSIAPSTLISSASTCSLISIIVFAY